MIPTPSGYQTPLCYVFVYYKPATTAPNPATMLTPIARTGANPRALSPIGDSRIAAPDEVDVLVEVPDEDLPLVEPLGLLVPEALVEPVGLAEVPEPVEEAVFVLLLGLPVGLLASAQRREEV